MLTDAQWAELGALGRACRPHAKVPPSNLRRTISAILWRHANGAKWRCRPGGARAVVDGGADLHPLVAPRRVGAPAGSGPGARRPARHDVPRRHQRPRPPEGGRRCGQGGDRTRRGAGEALGRSRGGYGTKAVVVADGSGRAIAFRVAPGQAHGLPHAVPLLDRLPGVPAGSWPTGATPATPFASMSGAEARDLPSPPKATRQPWLAQPGSTPTATASNASGAG